MFNSKDTNIKSEEGLLIAFCVIGFLSTVGGGYAGIISLFENRPLPALGLSLLIVGPILLLAVSCLYRSQKYQKYMWVLLAVIFISSTSLFREYFVVFKDYIF